VRVSSTLASDSVETDRELAPWRERIHVEGRGSKLAGADWLEPKAVVHLPAQGLIRIAVGLAIALHAGE
jgi:hypothetical protein